MRFLGQRYGIVGTARRHVRWPLRGATPAPPACDTPLPGAPVTKEWSSWQWHESPKSSRDRRRASQDAVEQGIARAAKTLKNVEGAWVQDQKVVVEKGKIVEYRVNLKVTFILEK